MGVRNEDVFSYYYYYFLLFAYYLTCFGRFACFGGFVSLVSVRVSVVSFRSFRHVVSGF